MAFIQFNIIKEQEPSSSSLTTSTGKALGNAMGRDPVCSECKMFLKTSINHFIPLKEKNPGCLLIKSVHMSQNILQSVAIVHHFTNNILRKEKQSPVCIHFYKSGLVTNISIFHGIFKMFSSIREISFKLKRSSIILKKKKKKQQLDEKIRLLPLHQVCTSF